VGIPNICTYLTRRHKNTVEEQIEEQMTLYEREKKGRKVTGTCRLGDMVLNATRWKEE